MSVRHRAETSGDPITHVPPPWKLKGTVYLISYWNKAGRLPEFTYSPLEADSKFSDARISRHKGGISQFQIIRYTESPVGPYDELIICPGNFEYEKRDGEQVKTKKNLRITRIYVSQKYTCWNGRKNWNIPKHLARFEFKELQGGSTNVKVFPHDTAGDPVEAQPSETPFFQATIQPMKWAPAFPFKLNWMTYLGVDIALVQPPLPEGKGSQGELSGTDKWCKIIPAQSSSRARLAWVDMSQRDDQGVLHAKNEHFWPGMGKWQLGVKVDDCDIDFGEGMYWEGP